MEKSVFYSKIDELQIAPGAQVTGSTVLSDLEDWDSLAVMSFIAMVDSDYGVILPAKAIGSCRTVDDLATLVEAQQGG